MGSDDCGYFLYSSSKIRKLCMLGVVQYVVLHILLILDAWDVPQGTANSNSTQASILQ
jgi:hypothetical protein